MHGRLKVKTPEEQVKEKLLEQQKKLQKFKSVCSDVIQSRKELGLPLLDKTASLLSTKPDLYSFWNIRKEILLNIKQNSSVEGENMLKKELNFLNDCLKSDPKSYGSWQHRCFVVDSMESPDWKNELELCSKFLEIDERNFHCWDYRRYIVKQSREPLESELEFTTKKIEHNFSNFSSWHYRSKILSELVSASKKSWESALSSDLLFVESAMFTDPDDQSGWLYHRWLLNRKKSITSIKGVFIDKKNKRFMLLISSPMQITDLNIEVISNEENVKLKWQTANQRKFCKLMVAHLESEQDEALWPYKLNFEISSPAFETGHKFIITCEFDNENQCHYFPTINESEIINPVTQSILEKQYDSLEVLHSSEPENKWIFLALMMVMMHLDSPDYQEKATKYLNELISLDHYRKHYYYDLVSTLKVEFKLKNLDKHARSIDFSNMSLTHMPHLESLCAMRCVNLSYNCLTSLDDAYFLQCVEVLILHHNQISDCSGITNLGDLKIIDISYNDIKCLEDILPLATCQQLETILITGNPITQDSDYEECIRKHFPNIKHIH